MALKTDSPAQDAEATLDVKVEIAPDAEAAEAALSEVADDVAAVEQDASGADEDAAALEADADEADAPVPADADADAYDEDELDDSEDSLTYSNGVIEKIVAMATREVPHVLGMKGNLIHFFQEQLGAKDLTKGVTVEVTDDNRVIVNISVIIEYGCYAPAIFEDVKKRVTERLTAMTGLEIAGINLRIEDVVTLEAYNESKKKFVDSLKNEEQAAE